MKKDIPFVIKVKYTRDPESLEKSLLLRYNQIFENGYIFPTHDFNLFCAVLIREKGLDNLPELFKKYTIENNAIRPDVQFQIIALALELREDVSEKELTIHFKARMKRAIERLKIVKKEIQTTGINSKKLTLDNSQDYRELINLVQEFDDLTLMDWFIPIVLKFEKIVHIYVKHVEETKFAIDKGQFRKRTFFDYKHTEILTLIKKVIGQEEQSIKDHFLEVALGHAIKDETKIKDYHRGFGKFPSIFLGGDEFRLTINKNGFIQTFYQKKT